MKLFITAQPRKDNKHKVTMAFDNGVRIGKLWTLKQIETELRQDTTIKAIYK